MIEMHAAPQLVEIRAKGTLTGDDYERLIPELERLAAERGPLNLYIELRDFEGWQPDGLWEEVKFDATHQDDMHRVAVVGETKWEEWGTRLSKPFFKADMRFFPPEEEAEARAWASQS
jgi:hypothetical protein